MEFLNRFIRQNIRPDEETDDDETDSAEESSEEVSSEEDEEENERNTNDSDDTSKVSEESSSASEDYSSSEESADEGEEEVSVEEEYVSGDEEEVSFSEGDKVKILTGTHQNKVGTIKQFTKNEKKAKVTLDTGKNTNYIELEKLQLVDSSSKVSDEEEEEEESSKVSDEEEGGEEKKSEESKSYEEMKEKFNNVIREKRGGLPKEYNGTEPQNSKRGKHKKIEGKECKEWYKMLKENFTLNIKLPFATVDQTGTNACSFLGFSLLCWLKNKDVFKEIYGEKTWKNLVEGKWTEEWEAVKENRPQEGSDKGGGMNNIGQMLDTVLDTYKINTTNLVYIPIRGTNDNNYNPDVVKKGTEYPNHLEKIQKYIENIIDTNKYLIMNTDQHTRVYFSYNDTHLLAIDSYPINKKQIRRKNNDTILDETKGGISKVNKFFVYRNVRDLAYFK